MNQRLLHVVRSLRRDTGGLAEAVRNLAAEQRRQGDTATVVSLDPTDAEGGKEGTVVVGARPHGYGYAPRYVRWLREHASGFDAVIVHGLWQYQSFGAWRALRGGPVPYAVFCHGMLDPWFKRAHPLKHLKKWLYWPWGEYRVLRDAAAVCFTAEEERLRARESFVLYRARERVTSLGIEEPPTDAAGQRAAFFAAYPELQTRPFLLFLGRIHPKKGVDLLLQAHAVARAHRPEGAMLAIAGPCSDAAYGEHLRQLAARLGIAPAVVWLPMLTGDVKWGAFRACEAFALVSHQENFGVAVVEALACGKPVLISDQINIWREIQTDGAGIVGSDTVAGATDAVTRWTALPADGRVAMGVAARASFARRFEIGKAVVALGELVGELRGGRR